MSDRLGYTFYPKDFISDPDVMMMDPSERGIYRDLIDLAYMSNNKIKHSIEKLAKYCNSNPEKVQEILDLKGENKGEFWCIPSCDKRIRKANTNRGNGSKGGRPKKPKENPQQNPNVNPNETQTERQREREREREREKENNAPICFEMFFNTCVSRADQRMFKITDEEVKNIWDDLELRKWKDGKGNKIANWQSWIQHRLDEIEKTWKEKNKPLKNVGKSNIIL